MPVVEVLLAVVRRERCRSHEQVVRTLFKQGLLDIRAVERLVAQKRVETLCGEGRGRCAAIAQVAEELHCSYEKIRAFIYHKN